MNGFPFKRRQESFQRIHELLERTPRPEHRERRLAHAVPWDEDQWKLYHAFKFNMRKSITPTLDKIKVRYEHFVDWSKTLKDYCTIHTGFYPHGYQTYLHHCFLFSSEYESSVKSLLSLFPTTTYIMEVQNQLLVFINALSSAITVRLFCLMYDMQVKHMIKGFRKAVTLFHNQSFVDHQPRSHH
jgi:hypothetical protein